MTTLYPGALDSYTNPSPGDSLSTAVGGRTHSQQHDDLNDAVHAIEAELGADPSSAGFSSVVARLAQLTMAHIDPAVNQYVRSPYAWATRVGTSANAAGTVKTFIPVGARYTVGSVVMRVTTAGAGGSTVPIRIFACDSTGRPGTTLSTTSCATSATGLAVETAITGGAHTVDPPGFWVDFGTFSDSTTQVQWLRSTSPGTNLNTSPGNLMADIGAPENGSPSLWLWIPDIAVKRTA